MHYIIIFLALLSKYISKSAKKIKKWCICRPGQAARQWAPPGVHIGYHKIPPKFHHLNNKHIFRWNTYENRKSR